MIFIYLNSGVEIPLEQISCHQILYASLKRRYTYKNPKFIENAKYGYSNHATPEYLYSFKINGKTIVFSYGTYKEIVAQCVKLNVEFNVIDNRITVPQIDFPESSITLREDQEDFVSSIVKNGYGTYVAFCSFGKSVSGLEAIRRIKQPTIIVVHTSFLQKQWISEAKNLFNYTDAMIGGVGGKFKKPKLGLVNICLYHSLSKPKNIEFYNGKVGFVIVDECQTVGIGAVTDAITSINCKWKIGISATPKRKDGKHFLVFDGVGKIQYEAVDKKSDSKIPAAVRFVNTNYMDTNYTLTNDYSTMITDASLDKSRNIFICKRALYHVKKGNTVIIFVERKEQAGILSRMLRKFRVDMVIGPVNKKVIEAQDKKGNFLVHSDVREILLNYNDKTAFDRVKLLAGNKKLDIIIGTQKAEVGLSIRTLNVGIVTTPIGNNTARFKQVKGRVERTYSDEQVEKFGVKHQPIIEVLVDAMPISYNARDKLIEFVENEKYLNSENIKKDVILRKGEKNVK